MRSLKHVTLFVLFLVVGFAISSCSDLSVQDLNQPSRKDVLSSADNLVSLLQGQTTNQFMEEFSLSGIHYDGWADQMTTTNNYDGFWDPAKEPRIRLDNSTSYTAKFVIEQDWDESNSSVSIANQIIDRIENEGGKVVLNDGTDVTQKMLAAAYFLRGIARGSLGMTYDQAYLVGPKDNPSTVPDFVPYTKLINGAVSDMDKAIDIANGVGSDFKWDFLPDAVNADLNLAQFKTVANSYSARFLACAPRNASEAASWDWDRVLKYAKKGVGGDNAAATMTNWTGSSIANTFWMNYMDWETTVYPPPAGYIPTDIKVIHMLDSSYPVEYPSTTAPDGTVVPDTLHKSDVNTNDPRIKYFYYSNSFGYLDPSRSIPLFSNYWNYRLYTQNTGYATSGYPVIFFVDAELDYIRAEAYLMNGNKVMAAQELNNSPYGSGQVHVSPHMPAVQLGNLSQDGFSGGNNISATASDAQFIQALHREYSVELALIDRKGLQWFFMRRHNLLQKGTPIELPVPASELEITQRETYTFGGADHAGETGTADGSNSWKKNAPKMLINSSSQGKYHANSSSLEKLGLNSVIGSGKKIKRQ